MYAQLFPFLGKCRLKHYCAHAAEYTLARVIHFRVIDGHPAANENSLYK